MFVRLRRSTTATSVEKSSDEPPVGAGPVVVPAAVEGANPVVPACVVRFDLRH